MSGQLEPGMAYDTKVLNRLFALLSVIFLFVVIWLFLDDYIRPWKVIQVEAQQIKRKKLETRLDEANKAVDQKQLAIILQKIEEGEKQIEKRREEIRQVEDKLAVIIVKIKDETIINGQLNSKVSALTFDYGVAHAQHLSNADKLKKQLHEEKRRFAESQDRMKGLEAQRKTSETELANLKKELLEAEKERRDLFGQRDLVRLAKSQTDINFIFALRNAPFLDFLDPTLRIQQIVLENITDDRYFQHVPKVDRCITCHTFIDQEGYEDQKNPHKTHPNLDLYIGLKSPHPMKKIGCTVCHGGEGHRVNDFNAAAHIPDGEKQTEEWIAKYNYHPPHKISQPMLKKKYTEASCLKCHQGVEFIPGADKLNEGKRLVEKYGCYSCHKIEGWEHKRRPGPSFHKIASKVTKEFFKNWVWNPKLFNKHTRMPHFFGQSNNSTPEFTVKNIAEVNAMAEAVWEKSEIYRPFGQYKEGNKEQGKELIRTIGCLGCHGVEGLEEESEKIMAHAGPYLNGMASKLDADWLVSWLQRPSHYQEDTIMPSFRLTEKEANDITAYLMSLRNQNFEKFTFEPINKKVRDEILLTYFSAFETLKSAQNKLAKMTDRERTLELGHRSIGKYGCYSCHEFKGFEGRTPIGPELSKEGSKPLTQFSFGHEHDVEHSRDGWIKAHLLNPRRWDRGAEKSFKDLARMPHFYMTEKEAELITLFLLGQVGDFIPMAGLKNMNQHEKIVSEGMKVAFKYNCIGCHSIDGQFGDIGAIYEEDLNEGPPQLNGQGHRVQVDWFYHFLSDVYPIRPGLKIRMPSFNFSTEEKNKIVALFQHKSEMEIFTNYQNIVQWKPGEKQAARQLFQALACDSCHTSGFNNDEALAPNLYFAKRRLRPSWVKKWMENPQAILEYTTMPNFWEDGESQEPDILEGDPVKQIDALTKYIYEIGTEKLPTKATNYWSKQ